MKRGVDLDVIVLPGSQVQLQETKEEEGEEEEEEEKKKKKKRREWQNKNVGKRILLILLLNSSLSSLLFRLFSNEKKETNREERKIDVTGALFVRVVVAPAVGLGGGVVLQHVSVDAQGLVVAPDASEQHGALLVQRVHLQKLADHLLRREILRGLEELEQLPPVRSWFFFKKKKRERKRNRRQGGKEPR